jgi:hypothetical protein
MKIRQPLQSTILVAGLFVFAVIGIDMEVTGPLGARILGAVLGIPAVIFGYRATRIGVDVDSSGVVHRGFERSHRISWCEVKEVSTRATASGAGIQAYALSLSLRDGDSLLLRGAASYMQERVKRETASVSALLEEHRSTCATCSESTNDES